MVVTQPRRELALEPFGADDVGIRLTQRLERALEEAMVHAPAPAVGLGAQHDDRHQVVHRDDHRTALHAGAQVRVRVIQDVHQGGAPRLEPQTQRIEEIAGGVAMRPVQRPGEHDPGRVHRLRPPLQEPAPAVGGLARQRTDLGGEAHLEPRRRGLEPVVPAMGVAVHRRPALERQVGNEQNAVRVRGQPAFPVTCDSKVSRAEPATKT